LERFAISKAKPIAKRSDFVAKASRRIKLQQNGPPFC
jgi:hypothetical protein